MHKSYFDRLISWLLSSSPDVVFDGLWWHFAAGFLLGTTTVLLWILIFRYFGRWAFEEIKIRRGRDSLETHKSISKPKNRKSVPGIRRRRKLLSSDSYGGTI